MSTRRALARRLGVVAGFEEPVAALEQYPTPPDIAAHLVHAADLHGDVEGRTVVDLGTGTGMLALGAALRGPERVVGVDVDRGALATARENERRVGTTAIVHWVQGDAGALPVCAPGSTVLMNPPFGAQTGREHADRAFLETAAATARVSYSVHNEGSREFVEAFARDHGGEVTHSFRAELDVDRQFSFHEADRATVDAEVFRVEWDGGAARSGRP